MNTKTKVKKKKSFKRKKKINFYGNLLEKPVNGRFFFRFILANDCETLNPNGVYEDSDEKKEENFFFIFRRCCYYCFFF